MNYNPSKPIDAEDWLAIDEGERLYAIQQWVADLIGSEPDRCMGAAVSILAVENQIASGDPPITRATLQRLRAADIDRMTAIQVMSDVFADSLAAAIVEDREHDSAAYAEALEQIDPAEIMLDETENDQSWESGPPFSPKYRQVLVDFGLKHEKEQALSWPETAGFMFAVMACPEFIAPSEWIEFVQGRAVFADPDEARKVSEARLELMNWVSECLDRDWLAIPEDCRSGADPLKILEVDNDFSRWCRGVVAGHFWLREAWEVEIEEDSDDDRVVSTAMMLFTFFSDRKMAETVLRDISESDESDPMTLEEAAQRFRPMVEAGALAYASVGLEHREAYYAPPPPPREPVRSVKVGRNQPCPCGSGLKYKKCCGGPRAPNQS